MSPSDPTQVEKARIVKDVHKQWLMNHANVVGVGIGLRQQGGKPTEDVAIVVMVRKKLPAAQLAPRDILPSMLEGVPLDVQETGTLIAG
jgi:hypothetical protein